MIGVIVNSNARGVLRDPRLPSRLRETLDGHGELRVTERPDEVARAVEEMAGLGARAIAVCGGDGAAMFAATALARRGPSPALPLALLPGGTMNTLCRNLGIRERPDALLSRLLRVCEAGERLRSRPHPTLRVDGKVGFLFGAGLVGNFFDVYYASPYRSRLYAAAQVSRIVFGALLRSSFSRRIVQPVEAEVEVDGAPLPWRRLTLVAAGTVPNVGVGLRVLHRATERVGAFHLVASGLRASELASQVHRTLVGRPLRGPRHHDGLATRARIRFARPSPFILDGEPYRTSEVLLEVGPPIPLVVV